MKDMNIYVIAHNIRSLWNVGSIFRTCDGFGVKKLFLTGYTGRPPRKEITKTALGADEFVAWEHVDEPMRVIEDLKKEGVQIVSLEQTDSSIEISDFEPKFPLCLILGSEIAGVRDDLLESSDAVVEIPMLGQKESFNVAVSTGIALNELRRKSVV
ncbi:RNA methyltransferase [Candidatus Peribacteria bacterium]|nr:RNA methyltransferase [Candidatus Peribacteria bacterium]MBT4020797.1 RNA methyltransferase [Candidatus Peribacteria bacterium]MBT4241007.1 RNA methyltransferase [Candidatus Peribacteria bacterium]MBT4474495.1 RNA methyltransferase [Candidatus Peribacteria bacterium]